MLADRPSTAHGLLVRAVRRHPAAVCGATALIVLWQVCETLVPVAIGLVIDRAVLGGSPLDLVLSLALLGALFTVLSLAYRFGARTGFTAAQQEQHRLRVEVAETVLRPRGARTDLSPGEILSVATSDSDRVVRVFPVIPRILSGLASIVVAAVVLLRADVLLGVVALVGSVVVLVVVQVASPRISRRTAEQQETAARATGVATDLLRGLRPLKGIGAEAVAARRFRVVSQQAAGASVRAGASFGLLNGLSVAAGGILLAVVAGIAGRLALQGDLSIGELIAVVGVAQYLTEPLNQIADSTATFVSAHTSARRLVRLLASEPLLPSGDRTLADEPPSLELVGVTTGPVEELSLHVRPGELLGLAVTEPGAADAIVRLVRGETPEGAYAGTVRLGDVPLPHLDLQTTRSTLVVEQHHSDILEGTIRSNIVSPASSLDDDVVLAAVRASAASDVVELHPAGLDRATASGGSNLSGGQRQRVALARSLAADPPVLVLHEPTTAVDAVTESRIAAGVRSARHTDGSTRATLVVTTSPALLAVADRVLLVDGGRVVAEGTHEQLTAHPAYRTAVLR